MKVGLNGFGRIGRNILRAYLERGDSKFEIVAINDLADTATNAHLLKYDSVHGTLDYDISSSEDSISVGNQTFKCFSERNPEDLPWKELGVDVVFECTGIFTTREKASLHLKAGASKVIISAPGKDVDRTVVFGVNHEELTSDDAIISNASCTTNCLAPLAKVINDNFVITNGLVNTIHAYTNDQSLLDVYHSDLLRARAAGQSMIPTKTGAASAVGEVIPELNGKLNGLAVRVPVVNVSLLDFTFNTEKDFTVEELNAVLEQASLNELRGVLDVNAVPLVSTDFKGNTNSSVYDKLHTQKIDKNTKILAWYDNEWGFSNRMLDLTSYVAENLVTQDIAA